ncbi:MAG TPA: hypothetical protein VK943_09700 [Arenibaculum sp.]|nr:hypothetical protein [Arenibaculum sp.]
MRKIFSGAALVLPMTMGMPSNVSAEDVGRTTATVFFGGYADGKLTSVWRSAAEEWDRSHVAGLAVEHRFARFAGKVDLGVEVQALRHWGDQSHGEFTGALVARWNPFPWDHIVDTSIAVGEGLSYASRVPELEIRKHRDSERLLNYLLVEAAFAPPGDPGLSFVVRVHHRSGVFGLFNGVKQGSNFLNFGLRWRI